MTIVDATERDRFDALVTELIEHKYAHPTPESPNDRVVSALMSTALLHRVGSRMNGAAGEEFTRAANQVASELLDEFCGTPPGPHPLGPGPRLIASLGAIVAALPPNSRIAVSIRGIAFAAAARTFGFGDADSDPMPA